MYRILYSVVFYLALPIILFRLLLRSVRAPAYRRRIKERLALQTPGPDFDRARQTLWIHSVSVGETAAAAPLVLELRRSYPEIQIVMTTMTPTGSERLRTLLDTRVFHSYIPYDVPDAVNRFLDKYKPELLILMETELWPNVIHSCHRRGIRVLLANARLSEKSARGYARFSSFTSNVLNEIDVIAAQAQADADRFIALGATNIKVTGSLKFNIHPGLVDSNLSPLFESITSSGRPVVIAASTREGEEEKVLRAFRQCQREFSSLLLILVPRHPERFSRVASLCENLGFRTQKRSEAKQLDARVQVLVGDSMGEMLQYYAVADIAFVGGSLVNTGCQNVLEPAAMALPVITGPSQFNFATNCEQLEQVAALKTVQNEAQLAEFLLHLLRDKNTQQEMGQRGKALVAANQNALPSLLKIIAPLIQARD